MIRVFRPIPVERLKLLVFDLDGTLIDSAQDLCNSVNETLKEFGHEPLLDPAIASFVGNGAPMLMRRSLALASNLRPDAVDDQLLAEAYAFFLKYYREHKLDFTYAYEGVLETLKALHELHEAPGGTRRTMAVLTNKPVRPARGICEGLGLASYFPQIYGGDSFAAKKPDPMGLRKLMEEAGALPEETAMIGDSQVDVQTARNAGAWAVGCAFGFGPQTLDETRADVVVDTAADWMEALSPARISLQP
ncbi:MAG TPA: HAD-IA family hydrolase [Terracidiphilus sp.]|jgi:phosphoglycolate phosphatase